MKNLWDKIQNIKRNKRQVQNKSRLAFLYELWYAMFGFRKDFSYPVCMCVDWRMYTVHEDKCLKLFQVFWT